MGCFESKENERPDPTAVRGCTDVFWLIIYVIFWILMVGLNKINSTNYFKGEAFVLLQ